jgi:hypothetical protein
MHPSGNTLLATILHQNPVLFDGAEQGRPVAGILNIHASPISGAFDRHF